MDQILEKGLTVREVEQASKPKTEPTSKRLTAPTPADPNDQALEEALSTYLGSPVKLHRSATGGKLSVEFYSDEDLDRILDVLGFRL